MEFFCIFVFVANDRGYSIFNLAMDTSDNRLNEQLAGSLISWNYLLLNFGNVSTATTKHHHNAD